MALLWCLWWCEGAWVLNTWLCDLGWMTSWVRTFLILKSGHQYLPPGIGHGYDLWDGMQWHMARVFYRSYHEAGSQWCDAQPMPPPPQAWPRAGLRGQSWKWRIPRWPAQSQNKKGCHACWLLGGPREMSFQAAVTRRINRKVNSSQCPRPVMISDDWVGSKWKWNRKRMTSWEERSRTAGRLGRQALHLSSCHGQVLRFSELWGTEGVVPSGW